MSSQIPNKDWKKANQANASAPKLWNSVDRRRMQRQRKHGAYHHPLPQRPPPTPLISPHLIIHGPASHGQPEPSNEAPVFAQSPASHTQAVPRHQAPVFKPSLLLPATLHSNLPPSTVTAMSATLPVSSQPTATATSGTLPTPARLKTRLLAVSCEHCRKQGLEFRQRGALATNPTSRATIELLLKRYASFILQYPIDRTRSNVTLVGKAGSYVSKEAPTQPTLTRHALIAG